MCKIYSPIKQRVIEFLGKQGIKKENFFSITKIARPNFYGANAKSELGGDKIIKILEAYPMLNPVWLLTGKGDMLLSDTGSGSEILTGKCGAEPENWIAYTDAFSFARYRYVSVRIGEICYNYGVTHEQLSKRTGVDYGMLTEVINGKKPAPVLLLQQIEKLFPNLNSIWLYCGEGSMHVVDCTCEI
jgi:hypothetical protein